MPGAYHSKFNEGSYRESCRCYLLPLRTNHRGPAPSTDDIDVIDEVNKAGGGRGEATSWLFPLFFFFRWLGFCCDIAPAAPRAHLP